MQVEEEMAKEGYQVEKEDEQWRSRRGRSKRRRVTYGERGGGEEEKVMLEEEYQADKEKYRR